MNSNPGINTLLLALPLVLLTACSAPSNQYKTVAVQPQPPAVTIHEMSSAEMIAEAQKAQEPRKSQLYLDAASKLIYSDPQQARGLLNLVNTELLNKAERINYYSVLASVEYRLGHYIDTIQALTKVVPEADMAAAQYDELWHSLQEISFAELQNLQTNPPSQEILAWAELAEIYRTPEDFAQQQANINRWKMHWAGSSALQFMPEALQNLENLQPYAPRRIAIMLPLSGSQASVGAAVRDGLMAGYYETQREGLGKMPELVFYDTEASNPMTQLAEIQAQGADLIIGPVRRSVAAEALKSRATVKVPWLLLNQVSNTDFNAPIFQFGLASENEAELAAQRAWADGYRNPLILTADSEWGRRVADSYKREWAELGGDVGKIYTFKNDGDYNAASSEALLVKSSSRRASTLSNILGQQVEYTPRRRQDIDMIFAAASPAQGRRLKPALDFYFAHDLPVYTVSNMYGGQPKPTQDQDLNNIRIPLMPWLSETSIVKTEIESNWPKSKGPLAPLFALGLDAWRIHPSLPQMVHTPNAQIVGSTGVLSVDKKREVKRELKWHRFYNGRPVPLSEKDSANLQAR